VGGVWDTGTLDWIEYSLLSHLTQINHVLCCGPVRQALAARQASRSARSWVRMQVHVCVCVCACMYVYAARVNVCVDVYVYAAACKLP
jgi:hypothetical protein